PKSHYECRTHTMSDVGGGFVPDPATAVRRDDENEGVFRTSAFAGVERLPVVHTRRSAQR
ncbi:MAG: hypothetical protein JWM31_58, partial [Solirubrobacterales bacterium]|nr:hypothetical protein [Solirubrobacterales bacterium]